MAQHLKTGTYAGKHYFDGGWYHHLLLETDAVGAQLWVAEGDAPEIRKVLITYRHVPGPPGRSQQGGDDVGCQDGQGRWDEKVRTQWACHRYFPLKIREESQQDACQEMAARRVISATACFSIRK